MWLTLVPRFLLPWFQLALVPLLLGGCTHTSPQEPSIEHPPAALPPGALLLPSAPQPTSALPPPSASAPQAETSAAPAVTAGPAPASSLAVLASSSSLAVAAPPCGSFSSGLGANISGEKVRALALAYYERTLRSRVRSWARGTMEKTEPGSNRLLQAMALRVPSVSSAEPVSESQAQTELEAFSSNKAHRIVCRAATVGHRPQWRVNLFTELPSPPYVTDIGMVLELFIDASSGEVSLVVYGPLLV